MKKQIKHKNKRKERRKNKNKENYVSSLGTVVASCSSSDTSVTKYLSIRCHIEVDFKLHPKRTERTSNLSQNYTRCVLHSAVQSHLWTTNCLVTWGIALYGRQLSEAVNISVPYDSVVTVSLNTYTSSERQLPSNLTYRRREHSFGKFWVQIWDQKSGYPVRGFPCFGTSVTDSTPGDD
jgi:hypothetical protein